MKNAGVAFAFLVGVGTSTALSALQGCEVFFCPGPFLDQVPLGTYEITYTWPDCEQPDCEALTGTLVVTHRHGDRGRGDRRRGELSGVVRLLSPAVYEARPEGLRCGSGLGLGPSRGGPIEGGVVSSVGCDA